MINKIEENSLKITTSIGLFNNWLVEEIIRFYQAHPQTKLEVCGSEEAFDINLHGFDVSISGYMHGRSDLIQEYLYTFEFALYAHNSYIEKYGIPRSLKELENHKLIAYSNDKSHVIGDINWHLKIGMPEGETREPAMSICASAESAIRIAKAGIGMISLVKNHTLLSKGGFVEISFEEKGPRKEFYYIYPKKLEKRDIIHQFKAYVKSIFPQ